MTRGTNVGHLGAVHEGGGEEGDPCLGARIATRHTVTGSIRSRPPAMSLALHGEVTPANVTVGTAEPQLGPVGIVRLDCAWDLETITQWRSVAPDL